MDNVKSKRASMVSFLKAHKKKITRQRLVLLDFFLKNREHLSPQEIYKEVRKIHPTYGWATVYRTLKIFSGAKFVRPVKLGDGAFRYEHKEIDGHHDHLVCLVCGDAIEFVDEKIEKLQEAAAKRRGFSPQSHSLEIYGVCRKCAAGRNPH